MVLCSTLVIYPSSVLPTGLPCPFYSICSWSREFSLPCVPIGLCNPVHPPWHSLLVPSLDLYPGPSCVCGSQTSSELEPNKLSLELHAWTFMCVSVCVLCSRGSHLLAPDTLREGCPHHHCGPQHPPSFISHQNNMKRS